MIIYDSNSTIIVSADPGLSHGRGGAWDHLWCGLHPVWFLELLELPNCHVFRFYWPENAGCFLQTVQTFRNLPNRFLELPNYRLWQAKAFLFYWPETAGCSLQTLQTVRSLPSRLLELPAVAGLRNLRNRLLEVPAVAGQVFPLLLARNCRMLPSNAPNPPKLPTRLLELPAVAGQVLPFLLARNCRMVPFQTLQTLRNLPNRLLELPAVAGQVLPFLLARNCRMLPSNTSNRPKPCKPAFGAATKPAKPALGAAKLWAVAGHVCPFLLARNCQMLPSNAPNPPKPSKPALGAAKLWLWQARSVFFTGPKLPDASFKCAKLSETCETACQRPCSPRARAALPPQTAEGGR